jgi:hypothetical protein
VAALLLAFLLLRLEATGPIKRLVRDSHSLARGELPRIQDALHPGPLGQIARAMNTTLDRLGTRPPTPQPPPLRRALPTPTSVERHKAIFDAPPPRSTSPTLADSPNSKDTPLPAPLPAHTYDHHLEQTPSVPTRVKRETLDYVDGPPLRLGEMAPAASSLSELKLGDEEDGPTAVAPGGAYQHMPQSDSQAVTTLGPPPQPEDPLDGEIRTVFNEFLETKQTCGEPTDALTFDKFSAKLRAQRDSLIAKYACKTVKFQVYIKDGKAALKATPVG